MLSSLPLISRSLHSMDGGPVPAFPSPFAGKNAQNQSSASIRLSYTDINLFARKGWPKNAPLFLQKPPLSPNPPLPPLPAPGVKRPAACVLQHRRKKSCKLPRGPKNFLRKSGKIKCTTSRFYDTIGALIPPGRPPKMTERRVLSVIRGPFPCFGEGTYFLRG